MDERELIIKIDNSLSFATYAQLDEDGTRLTASIETFSKSQDVTDHFYTDDFHDYEQTIPVVMFDSSNSPDEIRYNVTRDVARQIFVSAYRDWVLAHR